jgi:hypothetical protein
MGYEYFMNPPNAVKFSQIKTDVEKGLIGGLTPFQEINIEPGQFYIDDGAGNVLYIEKGKDNVGFARTYYSNYEWKILQRLMRYYGFNVVVPAMNNNLNDIVYEADDFEGLDDFIGSGKFNQVPEGYASMFKKGVSAIPAPMPRDMSGEWGRKYRYIKYREINGKVSRII